MRNRSKLASLELRVLRTIRKFEMIRRGDHVLVAVSGGSDSTALLHCLHNLAARLNLALTAAHLDHGLRGEESRGDKGFVQRLSVDLGLRFISEYVDVMGAAAGKNLEESAREARYAFLERAAAQAGADRIATGHTLDDQAETFLFRLLRGSGPGGLEGIRPAIGSRIVRPLLECSRSQVLEYLSEKNAAYREDSSNLDLRFQRNRIRHELIPYLKKHFNPQLPTILARVARLARATQEYLEHQARPIFEIMRIVSPDGIALPAPRLAELPPALRHQVLRLALYEVRGSLRGIGAVHIEAILSLCGTGQSGKRIQLPGGAGVARNLDLLEFREADRVPAVPFRYSLPWPGSCSVPEAGIEMAASIYEGAIPGPSASAFACRAHLNPDVLPAVLIVRSRLPGDHYGGPGHRKIKKMLLAARTPFPARETLPLVEAGDCVVWIPGFPPAKSFRAIAGFGRSVLIEARRRPRPTASRRK